MKYKSQGRRPKGRSRKKRIDVMEEDIEILS